VVDLLATSTKGVTQMKGHENSNSKQDSSPEIYSGSLIEGLFATVSRKMGIAEPATCRWESPETHYGACDGGEPCGRSVPAGEDRCEFHKEDSEEETRGEILREGLKRVGCPVL
jgi:hypothetical protein